MKYLKQLSLAAVIFAVAAAGFQLYKSDKSEMKPASLYDKMERIADKTVAYNDRDSGKKSMVEDLKDYTEQTAAVSNTANILLWAKIIFSGLFCLAALFVVLSNKYNDETKKWAFSVLTLIAGVWIGTVT